MTKVHRPHRVGLLPLLLLVVMITSLVLAGNVGAEGGYKEVPDYPLYGCYDVVTNGIGMWSDTVNPFAVNVPGPVVDAYLIWLGTEDVGAPGSPNQSDLTVNGVSVLGNLVDQKAIAGSSPWFMWRANIGPKGYNLIQQGKTVLSVSGWKAVPADYRRNGISAVVVYKTGDGLACTRPNQINLMDNFDWFWERTLYEQVSEPILYTFPMAPVEREVTVWLNYAGSDHNLEFRCRPEAVWQATGTGAPPPAAMTEGIIKYDAPSVGMHGGKLIGKDLFVKPYPNECAPEFFWPATSMEGGYTIPEWSIVKLKIHIPAGNTWLILQAESIKTNATVKEETGESGAWIVQASVFPLYEPELKITKTDGVTDAKPGDTLTYTINYENHGYGPAENTTIVDTLPQYMSFVSASNGGVFDLATRTVTWNLGTLDKGASGQVTIQVQLDPVFPAGTTAEINTAAITTTTPGEIDTSDNAATDTTNVFAKVELAINKVAVPDPVEAGAPLKYTIDWTVGGNAFAPGVKIVDTLPANVTFVAASDGGVYDPAANTVTWMLSPDPVTPVKTGTYTIDVTVKTPLYNGVKLPNAVTISDTIGDSASASTNTTVHSDHVLNIAKLAAPEPVEAGAQLTYTVNWAVTGNEPSPNAKIVDTLPSGVQFVSASGGGVFDGTQSITWSLGELMTPQSGSFTVVVLVPAPQYNGAQLTNSVVFSDTDPETQPATASVVSTVHADHVLDLTKSATPDPVAKGGQLTYTINWSVTGNEFADSMVLTDAVPFGTQFVSASDGGVFDPATGIVTWTLGNKIPPASGSVTMIVLVNKDFLNNLDIINHATLSDYKPEKTKNIEVPTKVIQTPMGSIGDTVWYDLNKNGIAEPGEPGIAGVGLILSEAGADGACGTADDVPVANATTNALGQYNFSGVAAGVYCVKVLDATLPSGLTLVSAPAMPVNLAEGQKYRDADFGYVGAGLLGGKVWSDANGNGVLDAGEVGIGNVTVELTTPGADNTCATVGSTIGTKTTGPDGSYLFSGLAGGKYCVKVTDANGVVVGKTLTGGTNPNGPITLPSGGSILDINFGYHDFAGQIGDLVFYDGNRSGVYDSASPTDHGINGVTLNLVAPGTDGALGTADDVVIASTTTDSNGWYSFTGVADGSYWVVVTDLNLRLAGYTQTYGVPNADNNGQVNPYPVTILGGNAVLTADFGYADGHILKITKTNNVPAGQPVEAGADMIYTIGWSFSGREAAPNVMIHDVLPVQLDFVSASDGGTYDPATRTVTWSLGTLDACPVTTAVGADGVLSACRSGTVTLTVHVKKPLPNNSFIFNTVTIIDDAKVTDEATDVVKVHAVPILSLTKAVDPTGTVKPGDTLTYNLCYANTGNGDATGVVLTDGIPQYTTYVSGSATGGAVYDAAARKLTWTLNTVGPDANVCATFQVTVDLTIPGVTEVDQGWSIVNTATLSSNELPALDATTSNHLNAFVKPVLTKTADPAGEVLPGNTIKYGLCYANQGTANLTGVTLTDVIPLNTTYVNGSATGGAVYSAADNKLTWAIGVLGPGANACVEFQVTVNMTIVGLTGQGGALTFAEWNSLSITNTATLHTDQVADKTATVVNPLNATVNLAIYKVVSVVHFPTPQIDPYAHTGETVVFTVTVTNNGTANATEVVLTDPISSKLEEITVTSSKGTASFDAVSRLVTVNIGVLAPNETVNVVITGKTVRVPAEELPYQIINKATVVFLEHQGHQQAHESNEVIVDVVYFMPGEVPEASTLLLLGTGLAGLAGYARMRVNARRRK